MVWRFEGPLVGTTLPRLALDLWKFIAPQLPEIWRDEGSKLSLASFSTTLCGFLCFLVMFLFGLRIFRFICWHLPQSNLFVWTKANPSFSTVYNEPVGNQNASSLEGTSFLGPKRMEIFSKRSGSLWTTQVKHPSGFERRAERGAGEIRFLAIPQ